MERIKVDPQFWIEEHWLTYPMEVRVVAAQVEGSLPIPGEPIAPINFPVDASAQRVWRRKYCSISETNSRKNALTVRDLVERNARQDAALLGRSTVEDITRTAGHQRRRPVVPRGPMFPVQRDRRTTCGLRDPDPPGRVNRRSAFSWEY